MIRYGFIHTKEDIKFLVLFAMDLLPFPVTFETVVDLITWCDDGFGYFELSEAFYEMIPTGHIDESIENGAKLYAITDKGRRNSEICETSLPYSVRLAADKNITAIHTSVTEHGEHDLTVRMEMEQVFAIEMAVVSHEQATMLERTFKANAEAIYQKLLGVMTQEYPD